MDINLSLNHEEEAIKQLEAEKAENKSAACKERVLSFYTENSSACEQAYNNYKSALESSESFIDFNSEDLSRKEFKKIIEGRKTMLVLTANKVEHNIFIWQLFQITKKKIKHYYLKRSTEGRNVYLVDLNEAILIHVDVDCTGDEATRKAINFICKFFEPKFITLLGICYGININQQEIGMVNISTYVAGVRINFRDKENSNEVVLQPITEFEAKPSSKVVKRITEKTKIIHFNDPITSRKIRVECGGFISANSIMSSKKAKNDIVGSLSTNGKSFIGGEMECCGLFKSSLMDKYDMHFGKWLIIKAICDWGECKNMLSSDPVENEKMKDSIQAFAAQNSSSVLYELIIKKIIELN